jgi:hypothetical protein
VRVGAAEEDARAEEEGGTGVRDFEVGAVGELGEQSEEGDFVVYRSQSSKVELISTLFMWTTTKRRVEPTSKTRLGVVATDGIDSNALAADEREDEPLTEIVVASEAEEVRVRLSRW